MNQVVYGQNVWKKAASYATILTLLLFAPFENARGQVAGGGGRLSGRVSDASGAALPNAQVTVKAVATGTSRAITTNSEGFYSVPELPAGIHEITVTASGFSTQVRTDIDLVAGKPVVVDVVMEAGDSRTVVRKKVTSLQRATSGVTGEVNDTTVKNVPLNGRDWTQVATLQSAVTGIQTANQESGHVGQHGFGAAMSISGGRPEQNNYRLDGISINDYSNGAPGSVLGTNLGVDAVKQVSVLENNYPAQYGRTSGGIINAVTNSGTKAVHGSVYEFLRNSALDARNFFDSSIPPFRRNQFGGSLGGPIRKGRTFFFADYEGLRQSLGITRIDTVPSAAAREGRLSAGFVQVDPAVARYLQAFYPLPNGPLLGGGDTGIFSFANQQVTVENYVTAKLDHKVGPKDSLSATYMRDTSKVVRPDTLNELLLGMTSSRETAVLQEQHVFGPALLNIFRFGFNRAVAVDGGVGKVYNPLLTDRSFGLIPGQFVGSIGSIPGLTDFQGGPDASSPGKFSHSQAFTWNSFQGYDDAFLTSGKHTLQFGAAVERMQDNESLLSGANGDFTFSSLSAFLTNQPQTFQGLIPGTVGVFGTRQTIFALYLQDDIRARTDLTLNLGLRYETSSVPTEAHNRISNLRNLTDAVPQVGLPYFVNPTRFNLEPRVGFAWDPFHNGKTVLRSGFGIFDVLPLPYEFNIITPFASPFSQSFNVATLPAGSFPTGAFTEFSANSMVKRASYVEHDPQRNYVLQWNFNIEQEVSSGVSATIGYVGSRGVHQPFRMDDFNTVLPQLTDRGYLYPPASTSVRLNPNFGRISGTMWQGNSFYNALVASVTKKMSHGFQVRGSYTWAKSIDTSSVTIAGDSFANSLVNPLFFDTRTNRGLSDFNIGQNLVLNYTWELPSPTLNSSLASWASSGWQLGGIYKANTGVPFTPVIGGDPLGTKLTTAQDVPDIVNSPECRNPINPGNPDNYIKTQCFTFPVPGNLRGNLGRNRLEGPGLSNFDVSLFKNNRIKRVSDAMNVQFRAEFFNVFNHANFSIPTNNFTLFDGSSNPIAAAGRITSTTTTSRQVQFAIKVIW